MNKLNYKKVKIEENSNGNQSTTSKAIVKYQTPPIKRDLSIYNNNNKSKYNSNVYDEENNGNDSDDKNIICTKKEDSMLLKLIKKHGIGNWDIIDSKMDRRKKLQCLGRWNKLKTSLSELQLSKIPVIKEKIKTWTPEEDLMLLSLVKKNGAKNWNYISSKMPLRTFSQCRARYVDYLNSKRVWSIEEDRKLRVLVELNGQDDWNFIQSQMTGRTVRECIYRWKNVLKTESSTCVEIITLDEDQDINYSTHKKEKEHEVNMEENNNNTQENDDINEVNGKRFWTREEEEKLKNLVKENGPRWTLISTLLNANYSRSPAQCSSKWYKLKKLNKTTSKSISTSKSKSISKPTSTSTKSNFVSKSSLQIKQDLIPIVSRSFVDKSMSRLCMKSNITNHNTLIISRGWNSKQDRKLIRLIELFGTDDFDYISSKFKNKTSSECKDRWNNHLKSKYLNPVVNNDNDNNDSHSNNNISNNNNHNISDNSDNESNPSTSSKKRKWSFEEDNKLIKEVELWNKSGNLNVSNKWNQISSNMKGRNAGACYNRFIKYLKKS